MDEISSNTLKKARKHLQNGQRKQARAILVELLKQDQNIESAWYMLAFSVTDPDKQAQALRQVLRLNPNNHKAEAHLEQVLKGEPLSISGKKPQSKKDTTGNSGKAIHTTENSAEIFERPKTR